MMTSLKFAATAVLGIVLVSGVVADASAKAATTHRATVSHHVAAASVHKTHRLHVAHGHHGHKVNVARRSTTTRPVAKGTAAATRTSAATQRRQTVAHRVGGKASVIR